MPDPTSRTPQQTTVDVLVVGGGPTGLTLACDLARRGVRTHVIEATERLPAGSRGKSLQARTLEAFDDLGLTDAVKAAGGPFP
ncbi:FAD-dependent oxidoreductase, partial [Streptomyces sp. NPDC006265]|uniref:FAD-dependent oxidoreductase n=1 Tax=Streptomyces sp. NPDC006265 TaxID=3156740 RepID=UPI00339EC52E